MRARIGVIGAGIVGLAVARRLGEAEESAELTVIDKENRVGTHQTGHNSGVVHAGVYYRPGSLKAGLCRRGMELLRDYCEQRVIPYEECGKLIVARNPGELGLLDELEGRAVANGVPGLRRLDATQMLEVEPHVRGLGALHSPRTAIVDFHQVARAYADDIVALGGSLRLGFGVGAITAAGGELRVTGTEGEELAFDRLVVCGGLQSDRLARMAGQPRGPRIVPFRGEYHRLVAARSELVRGLVYPVPDPSYPFLGVHFTRRVDGRVDIGPNAVLALSLEGYRRRDVSPTQVLDLLGYPGFRRMARRHWRAGLAEMLGSLSRRAFLARAREFVPELSADDVESAPAGVRAQAVDRDGSFVDDFRITRSGGLVLVRNAPSPAATSSLAIAEHVVSALRSEP